MTITFGFETQIIDQVVGYPVDGPPTAKSWQAKLTCDAESHGNGRKQRFEFQSNHPNKAEAIRLCFESFLNNQVWTVRETRWEKEGRESGCETLVLNMQFLSQEYQDLLWQLIDAKTGADRTAKLKIASQFGFPATFPATI